MSRLNKVCGKGCTNLANSTNRGAWNVHRHLIRPSLARAAENILVKSYSRCQVKVIDLGSSCFVTDHLSSYVQVGQRGVH